MKKALLALAVLTISSAYAANTTLITAIQNNDGKAPVIYQAFSESSFDYDGSVKPENTTICYVGKAQDVCTIIKNYADDMNEAYSSGAHDAMTVISCEASADAVKASYELTDDYGGDLTVNRTIEACY